MKLSICIESCFAAVDLVARLEAIGRHGLLDFELWDVHAYQPEMLRHAIVTERYHLALFCGNRRYSLIDPSDRRDVMRELRTNLSVAKKLKCPGVTVLSDAVDDCGIPIPTRASLTRDQKLASLQDGLVEAVSLAEELGVTLLLEPLNSKIDHPGMALDQALEAFETVQSINSPWLRVLFDVYHMQVMEVDVTKTIESHLDLIGHLHVADVPGRHEPGTGTIDFASIAQILSANGFDKYVGLECLPRVNGDIAVKAFLRAFGPYQEPGAFTIGSRGGCTETTA